MTYKDFAIEDRARLPIEDAFVKLLAGAMRLAMVDHRMRVCVLVAINHVKPINPAFCAFMVHHNVDGVTRKRRAQIDCSRVVTRVRPQLGISRGDVKSARALALYFEVLQMRAPAKLDIDDRVR